MHRPAELVHIRAKNRIDQMRKRHLPVLNTDQGHRCKKRHNPLGIIKNSRRFVDQHEAECDQSIQNPRHQPVHDHFKSIDQLLAHAASPSSSWATPR